ncbi:hypothetical protein LBMAG56_51600 [Verrucomicrobiota bacterium]|nr:hypothetical protein LBMAG56_51600 [Verrucomicrobiota bacterium]
MSEKTKILLVGDNWDFLQLLAAVLKKHGFDVAATTDPLDAPALVRQFQPDIIILDELTQRSICVLHFARSEPAFTNTPIFIITDSMGDPPRENETMPVNWHVCPKPVPRDWFIASIQYAVATARAKAPGHPAEKTEVGDP